MDHLTKDRFKFLMCKYPDFRVITGCWIERDDDGNVCGGCALALAFIHDHPSGWEHGSGITNAEVRQWAIAKFGKPYVEEFMCGFDSEDPEIAKDLYGSAGAADGADCISAAEELHRL